MNEKEAQNIMDAIETIEEFSDFSLDQLLALQKIIGYVIAEKQKVNDTKERL